MALDLEDWEIFVSRDYRPILKDCYLDDGSGKFIFELKKTEAQALCRAFDEKTKRTPAQSTSSQSYPGAASKVCLFLAQNSPIQFWGQILKTQSYSKKRQSVSIPIWIFWPS